MATIIYLIRHGETQGAESRRYKGQTDVPLSERGIQQMEEVSRNLDSGPLAAVYSSDLQRALRSAECIAHSKKAAVVTRTEFRERNFGQWEGLTFDECRERHPEEFSAWVENPLQFSPAGGESTLAVRDRVVPAVESLLKFHRGEAFAVVSHGGVNRVLLCHFLGAPLENIFRIDQSFGAVNRVDFWDDFPVVTLVNGVFYGPNLGKQ